MAEVPDGWNDDYEQRYRGYLDRKEALGESPRDRADWRTASEKFQSLRQDGDAFRDAGWQELGFDRSEWRPERQEPTALGPRRYDIGSIEDQIGYEFKLGGGQSEATRTQLAKDELNLKRDWDVVWFCEDQSKFSQDVRDRMTALQQRYPDQFHAYDLTEIRGQGSAYEPQNDYDRQAKKLADLNFTPPSQAQGAAPQSTPDLEPKAAEALRQSQASQARPATDATRSRSGPDPGAESSRTGAFAAARRQSQTHGTVTNGPAINSSGMNRPTPGRGGPAR